MRGDGAGPFISPRDSVSWGDLPVYAWYDYGL